MKPTIFLFPAIIAAALFTAHFPTFAPAKQAFSSNIIGFTMQNVPQGQNLLGSSLRPLPSAIKTSESVFAGQLDGEFSAGDTVRFYDTQNNTFVIFQYYAGDLIDMKSATPYGNTGWGINFHKADFYLEPGTAFWLTTTSPSTRIMLSGSIERTTSPVVEIAAGMNLVSAPFPIDNKLTDLKFDGFAEGDKIMFYDQINRTYVSLEWYEGNLAFLENPLAEGHSGWGIDGIAHDYPIPRFTGFWVNAAKPATIKFSSPRFY